jgi:hypothetical protein
LCSESRGQGAHCHGGIKEGREKMPEDVMDRVLLNKLPPGLYHFPVAFRGDDFNWKSKDAHNSEVIHYGSKEHGFLTELLKFKFNLCHTQLEESTGASHLTSFLHVSTSIAPLMSCEDYMSGCLKRVWKKIWSVVRAQPRFAVNIFIL